MITKASLLLDINSSSLMESIGTNEKENIKNLVFVDITISLKLTI